MERVWRWSSSVAHLARRTALAVFALGALAVPGTAYAGDWNVAVGASSSASASTVSGDTTIFYPTGSGAQIAAADVEAALASTAKVLVTTSDRGLSTGTEAGTLTLATALSLPSGTTTLSSAGALALNAAIDGPGALELTSGAAISGVGAATLGATTALATLTVNATAGTTLAATTVTTTGAQDWTGPVDFTSAGNDTTNLRATTSGTIHVRGALTGTNSLALTTSASRQVILDAGAYVRFSQPPGGPAMAGSALSINGAARLKGTFDATLSANISGPAELAGDTIIGNAETLVSLGIQSVTGPHALTLLGGFSPRLGGDVDVASLSVSGAHGFLSVDASTIATTGDASLNAPSITFNAPLTINSGGNVTVGKSHELGGSVAISLTINSPGKTTLGVQKAGTRFGAITTDAPGTTELSGDLVARDTITLADPVTVATPANPPALAMSLTADSIDVVSPGGAGRELTLAATTAATIRGPLPASPLKRLTSTGPTILASGTAVAAADGVTLAGVQLAGNATIASGGTGISLGAVDGAHTLGLSTTAGSSDLTGAIGATTPPTALTISGATTLTDGRIAVAGAVHALGSVALGADTSITADSVVIDGAIDGAHAVEVDSPATIGGTIGTTTVPTSLWFKQATTVSGSQLRATGQVRFDAPITLGADTLLRSTGQGVNVGSSIDGAHGVSMQSATATELHGDVGGTAPPTSVAVTGDAQLSSGVSLTTPALSVSGDTTLASGTPITLAVAGTLTGALRGAGSFVKTGDGRLTVLGTSAATGAARVSQGTLRVSGSLATASGVTVDGTGTLDGTGTVPEITATAGSLAGGNGGVEQLSAGAVTLASGMTVRATVLGNAISSLATSGPITLGSASLAVTAPSVAPAIGVPLLLVDVAGSAKASGTFAGLPEGSSATFSGMTFQISYAGGDGNDITLTRIPTPTPAQPDGGSTPGTTEIPDRVAPTIAAGANATVDKRGNVKLVLRPCVGEAGACRGAVSISTTRKGRALALAAPSFSASGGASVTLRFRLSTSARTLLRQRGKLTLRAAVTSTDAAANRSRRTLSVLLRR